MGRKKLVPDDNKPYCQCCGEKHNEMDSLVVCLKCFRLFERSVRVDLLRKAYANLVMMAKSSGITVEELAANNTILDENGRLKVDVRKQAQTSQGRTETLRPL